MNSRSGQCNVPMADENIDHAATLAEEALPIGTKLSGDQFTVTGYLGAGGFGITYHAEDNVLGRTIVIKECFPAEICARAGRSAVARSKSYAKPMRSIVKMFMREARSLAKLRHPNIVGVHRAFEENETAYMVLDLIDGHDLFDVIESSTTRLSPVRVNDILLQLLDAIEKVHELGLLHRDISPDNILIEKTGTPVLIDFGAARGDSNHHTRAVSSLLVVKDGYSPQEFYVAGSEQTPSSDLYALAATFYHVLSGKAPTNSQTRIIEIAGRRPDPCAPLVGRIEGYDQEFLQAIDTALQIHPGDRLQSAAKWRSMISNVGAEAISKSRSDGRPPGVKIPLDLELSLSQLVKETNDIVRTTSQTSSEPEPVVTPRDDRTKPAWIEEFNREIPAPARRTKPAKVALNAPKIADPVSEEPKVWSDSRRAYLSRRPVRSETNWVDRALEKQERIRSERESQLEIFQASSPGDVRSTPTQTASNSWLEGAVAPASESRPKVRPIGIVFGLLFCFCLFAFLNAVEGRQSQAALKAEVGTLEMSGSIIP